MASKEAAVLVVDVGANMWRTCDRDGQSHLDKACAAIASILHTKVPCNALRVCSAFLKSRLGNQIVGGRKTDVVSLVLVGTDDTDNPLHKQLNNQYMHIKVASGIEMASLQTLKFVTDGCEKGSQTGAGDILDGIVVAIHMLQTHCKHLKWEKQVFVLSDFSSPINPDDDGSIVAKAEDYDVKINVIGFGFKDEPPSEMDESTRAKNERFMRTFSATTSGGVFSGDEALALLGELRAKSVKPTTLIRHTLTLGDPFESTDTSISISVWAYAKVKEAKLPSAKKWSRVGAEAVDAAHELFKGEVVMERSYRLKDIPVDERADMDGESPDDIELSKDDLIRAYKYGKDLIPFSEEDRDAMKLMSSKGFSIIGFVKKSEVSRELFINDPIQMIPDPGSLGHSKRLFEVLALSMQSKDVFALVRYVRIDNAAPKLGVLIPHIGKKIWCAWLQLPFKEDVREYSFTTLAPLLFNPGMTQTPSFQESSSASLASDTLSQGSLAGNGESKRRKLNHRLIDSNEADKQLDKFIDEMDLMNAIEDDGAMNPASTELPPLDPRFVAGVLPLPEMVDKAKSSLENVKAAFEITKIEIDKVSNKQKFKKSLEKAKELERRLIDAAGEAVRLEIGDKQQQNFEALSGALIESVGTADPVGDFKALLAHGGSAIVNVTMSQMAKCILSFVQESFGSQFYGKALSCIVAFRDASVVHQSCTTYNDLMMELKSMCKGEEGVLNSFWDVWKKAGVAGGAGLVTKDEVPTSHYSRADAAEFFSTSSLSAPMTQDDKHIEEVDEQDLIDMLD
ncbi:SPOC like C-terminal domain-containing protein [Chytriomyces sp. MP71]|nr:SPOC like C-terminal domain-containing protein [Chytriomyces sp. MP71]